MINAAIVGLGWWGRQIVNTVQGNSEKIRLVRCIDAAPDNARQFAAEKNLPLSADIQDAFDDPAVDAVILCTPHSLHEDQIVRAAAAGKHVFCEKPLALTGDSAERAVAACEAAGVVLGVGHERRFEPAVPEIKKVIDSGEIGTIMHINSDFSHDSLANVQPGTWRTSPKESPAAGMTATGIHMTDIYIHLLGPVDAVSVMTAKRVLPFETGDVLSLQMKFKCGATGFINSVLKTSLYMRLHVLGSEGWVEARDTARPEARGKTLLTVFRRGGQPETRELQMPDPVLINLEAFAEAAAGGAPYPITREEKVLNIATFEAICASAESCQTVNVR